MKAVMTKTLYLGHMAGREYNGIRSMGICGLVDSYRALDHRSEGLKFASHCCFSEAVLGSFTFNAASAYPAVMGTCQTKSVLQRLKKSSFLHTCTCMTSGLYSPREDEIA